MPGSPGRRLLRSALLAATTAAVLTVETTGPVAAWTTGYGHVRAADGELRPGCHHYGYRYLVKPRTSDWTLETWLYDPRGHPKGAGDFQGGGDPVEGRGSFGLCRVGSRYGRYTIRARLRWYDDPLLPGQSATRHTVWLKPARFRLHR